MDWGVVLLLAAITWLDGVRRVPAGALVLRRALGGEWTVVEPVDPEGTWRVVAWWSPFTVGLVVPAGGAIDVRDPGALSDDRLAARLARSGRAVLTSRLLGAMIVLGIVGGAPAAAARFGTAGFFGAITGVLLLALSSTAVASFALRGLGLPWGRAVRIAAPLVSPFGAPRAAEVVLDQAIAGAPALMVTRRLLGATSFAAWVRPQAYDALRARDAHGAGAALVTLLGRPGIAAIVETAPASVGPDEGYCARCARVYRTGTRACAECNVRLLRLG